MLGVTACERDPVAVGQGPSEPSTPSGPMEETMDSQRDHVTRRAFLHQAGILGVSATISSLVAVACSSSVPPAPAATASGAATAAPSNAATTAPAAAATTASAPTAAAVAAAPTTAAATAAAKHTL